MSWIEKWLGSNVTYDLAWLEKWLWKMAVDVCCCSRKFTAEFSYGGASRVYMRINDPTATVTKLFGAAEEPTALPPSLATLKPAWDHPPKKSLKSPQLFWPSGGRRVSFIQKISFPLYTIFEPIASKMSGFREGEGLINFHHVTKYSNEDFSWNLQTWNKILFLILKL